MHAVPATQKSARVPVGKKNSKKHVALWETPRQRLAVFIAKETDTKCRICGRALASVHSREMHELLAHQFTNNYKSKYPSKD